MSRCQLLVVVALIFGLDIRSSSNSLIAPIFLELLVVVNIMRCYLAVILCLQTLLSPAGFTDLTLAVGQLNIVILKVTITWVIAFRRSNILTILGAAPGSRWMRHLIFLLYVTPLTSFFMKILVDGVIARNIITVLH